MSGTFVFGLPDLHRIFTDHKEKHSSITGTEGLSGLECGRNVFEGLHVVNGLVGTPLLPVIVLGWKWRAELIRVPKRAF